MMPAGKSHVILQLSGGVVTVIGVLTGYGVIFDTLIVVVLNNIILKLLKQECQFHLFYASTDTAIGKE